MRRRFSIPSVVGRHVLRLRPLAIAIAVTLLVSHLLTPLL